MPNPFTSVSESGRDDTKDFVKEMRGMNVTPHVSQNTKRQGGSAIDGRTTRHDGYQVSQRKRCEPQLRPTSQIILGRLSLPAKRHCSPKLFRRISG